MLKVRASDFPQDARRELEGAGVRLKSAVEVSGGWDLVCPEDRIGDLVGVLSQFRAAIYAIDPVGRGSS